MLRGFSIVRTTSCMILAALLVLSCSVCASAQQIEVSLNVLYDGANPANGGTWQIAAKTDAEPTTYGIAGLQILLTGVTAGSEQLVAPRGFVNSTDPAGMSLIDAFNVLSYREIDILQRRVITLGGGEEQSIFYGIGSLANGAPDYPGAPMGSQSIGPAFASLDNVMGEIPWGDGDILGDSNWDSAAVLVTGTFAAGSTPTFYSDPTHMSSGNVYISEGTSTTVGDIMLIESLLTTVRTNAVATLPDYNGNGFVDAADYTVWRDAVTAGSTTLLNDTTPGTVDESDFIVWRDFFGQMVPGSGSGAGAGVGSATVPEPASGTLLLGAVLVLFLRPKIGLLRKVSFR